MKEFKFEFEVFSDKVIGFMFAACIALFPTSSVFATLQVDNIHAFPLMVLLGIIAILAAFGASKLLYITKNCQFVFITFICLTIPHVIATIAQYGELSVLSQWAVSAISIMVSLLLYTANSEEFYSKLEKCIEYSITASLVFGVMAWMAVSTQMYTIPLALASLWVSITAYLFKPDNNRSILVNPLLSVITTSILLTLVLISLYH